jgi:tRNA(Glu) U13 pseudouridine synthase TruD
VDLTQNTVKDFRLPGSYRRIVQRASNVEWSLVEYGGTGEDTDPLWENDLDLLTGTQKAVNANFLAGTQAQKKKAASANKADASKEGLTEDKDDAAGAGAAAAGDAVPRETEGPGAGEAMHVADRGTAHPADADAAPSSADGGGSAPKKDKVALRIGFTLPASTYATMLIRQLTRQCTDDLMGQESNYTAGGGAAKSVPLEAMAPAPAVTEPLLF